MGLEILWLLTIPMIFLTLFLVRYWKNKHLTENTPKQALSPEKNESWIEISTQIAILNEKAKQLDAIGEKIEAIKEKQDTETREIREKLYSEYSQKFQDSIGILKQTYEAMNETTTKAFREIADRSSDSAKQMNTATANAFKEITDRNVEVYKQTGTTTISAMKEITSRNIEAFQQAATQINASTANTFREITNRSLEVYKQTTFQLNSMTEKLENAFKVLEERDHATMKSEIKSLEQKIIDLQRDPLKIQLEELGEARTAQAVHEQSLRKICTIFWPNNSEIKFNERIGQYAPDVVITNHKLKIVADEVTSENVSSIREKIQRVAEYMEALRCHASYVIIPNSGLSLELLRELRRTAPRAVYITRLSEFGIHLQVWHEVITTGLVDVGSLVERGHSFLAVLEPVFEEFLAIVQGIEQREEKEAAYRFNRYKELKMFPSKVFDAIEKTQQEIR